MRKTAFFIALIVLFSSSYALGSSIGGAETQGKGKLSAAVEWEYVFSRGFRK
jgi:hypothetical protein